MWNFLYHFGMNINTVTETREQQTWHGTLKQGALADISQEMLCKEGIVLVRVSIATMKYQDQRAGWGGKGLFGLHFHDAVYH